MLDDITRLTSDWVWSLDQEFKLDFISDRLFDSCGIAPDEAIGKVLMDIGTFPDQHPDFEKPFRDVPYDVPTPDGRVRKLLVSALPVFSQETGQFVGVRGIARDITERLEAERETNRLSSAIEEMSEMFYLSDDQDRLVIVNKPARDVNKSIIDKLAPGTPFEEFVSASAFAGLVTEAIGDEQKWIERRMERHRNPDRPFEIQREDGTFYLIHEEKLPDGSTATFSFDITDRKRMERALQESVKRQREFADDVAHELRTPLAVLRANLDSFDNSADVHSLKSEVDRVSKIVEELLAESRVDGLEIESGERADLLSIARSVAAYAAPLAIRRGRSIEVTGVEGAVWVWGRTEALEQAVRNLVDNAIDHAAEETVITIKVTASPAVYVIERGPGVPQEIRDTIFRRQLRSDRRGVERQGLGVVRQIADVHGATVGVDEAPEGGAVFYIRFPEFQQVSSD